MLPGRVESQLAARVPSIVEGRKTAKARQMFCHGPCHFAAWFFSFAVAANLTEDLT